jgi:hypothetical protein
MNMYQLMKATGDDLSKTTKTVAPWTTGSRVDHSLPFEVFIADGFDCDVSVLWLDLPDENKLP